MSLSIKYPVETLETKGCIRRIKKVTRSYMFSILGYSLEKNIDIGQFLASTIFDVGGHDWRIMYFPNGLNETQQDDISIYLLLRSKSKGVKAQISFTILDQTGCALPFTKTTEVVNFTTSNFWSYSSLGKRAELESNITDDCFVIKSVVSVFNVFAVEPTEVFAMEPTAQIVVPPGNILQQLNYLLETGNGADVTFEVDGQTLSAHKCILATRSPVFAAEFFNPIKEKFDTVIKIEQMEAPVFKALLHFIYNDSFPGFEERKENDDAKLMAQHLLVAADRYDLERLKIMCEKMLCGSIDSSNVVALLSLAENHSCNHLKEICLKFLASPEILKNHPLILKELLEKQG